MGTRRVQLLGDDGVVDPGADLVGQELGEHRVGPLVEQHVAEVGQPDGEAGCVVELLEVLVALLVGHLEGHAAVDAVDEAPGGLAAALEDLVVAGLDVGHLLRRDRGVT